MTMYSSVCAKCSRFDVKNLDKETCTAFPEGIPEDIILGKSKHLAPVAGDHGLVFDPLPGFEYLVVEAAR